VIPQCIPHWINGVECAAAGGPVLDKLDPASGARLWTVADAMAGDVDLAVAAAKAAQPAWADRPAPARGTVLLDMALAMRRHREEIAEVVARETGKSPREALGETDGAISLGLFFAGEGQRLFGRTLQSGVPGKFGSTIRQPIGVAGLIVAANTPIANIAWKVFPALVCGNAAVLKMAEDTPATGWIFGRIAHEAGLPPGVLGILQGRGATAGAALTESPDVGVVSFTGSTAVGRRIAEVCGRRLARVSLELGGKNPLVVCDDADLEGAVRWTVLSAFSNAGQRCAAASRVIVFAPVYEAFKEKLLAATARLKVGPTNDDDLGPVINLRQLEAMRAAVAQAKSQGGRILCGGDRLDDPAHAQGFYMAPTLYEGVPMAAPISQTELFGPVAGLYPARDFEEALALANATAYGLTASIHSASVHRCLLFAQRVRAGLVNANIGTYGSEPHCPFGGFGQSGNGSREPGTEALDVYSELKAIYTVVDAARL
jgi:aldehyde dehydrogenase (NAD+)